MVSLKHWLENPPIITDEKAKHHPQDEFLTRCLQGKFLLYYPSQDNHQTLKIKISKNQTV